MPSSTTPCCSNTRGEKDYCFPGQQTLAEDMGSAERSVRTYQKELEDVRFLEVTQRGLGKTNLYTLDLTVQRKGESRITRSLPALTGKICRSRPAKVAALSGKIAAHSI